MPGPVVLVGPADHANKDGIGGEQAKLSQPPTGVAVPSSGAVLCGVCGHGFPDRLQLWEHIHHCDYIAMADLKTNIIALPAITRSIKWCQYKCNYSEKDSSGCPIVLAVCRRLLDARIPCASRPVGTTGAADTMLAALETITTQPGSTLTHDSVQPADTSQTGQTVHLDVPDDWEVWVFHTVIPESQAIELVHIPPEFQLVDSGDIAWSSPFAVDLQSPTTGLASSRLGYTSTDQTHVLLHRALDNLIDRALLPLSIVRFGFRQWITLDGLPTLPLPQPLQPNAGPLNAFSAKAEAKPRVDKWQLPLTPPSPDLEFSTDALDFLAASSRLGSKKHIDPPPVATAASSIDPPEDATAAMCVLRFSTVLSSQGLVLQQSATAVASLRPISDTEEALRSSPGSSSLPRTPYTPGSSSRFTYLALARVAPYALPAKIISLPEAYLGDLEERILDAWSLLFGYPHKLLVASALRTEHCDSSNPSSLAWITLSDDNEPMLYPRRLILVDQNSISTIPAGPSHDPKPLAASEPVPADGPGQKSTDLAMLSEDSAMESVESKPNLGDKHSESGEREEGEDIEDGEEGEYDEEGEISDPPKSTPVTPRTIPVDPELDAVVDHFCTDAPPVLEQSLAAIRQSMCQFQAEARIEQEAEEAHKREQLASIGSKKEFPAFDSTVADGSKFSSGSAKSTAAAAAGGTKKRPRSNTRDEVPNKSRRKSVSTASASVKSTKANSTSRAAPMATPVSNDSTPLADGLIATAIPPSNSIDSISPIESSAASGEKTVGSTIDIDMLFGETGIDDEAAGLVVAEGGMVGDDMSLGMGLGMGGIGDNLDVDMGGFTTSMFGVTDDDFDFFDSVPAANQQQQQQQQQNFQAKAEPSAALPHMMAFESMIVDSNPSSSLIQASTDVPLGGALDMSTNHPISALNTNGMVDEPMQDSMDDLFDEGMFDSFFGGPVSAAPLADAVSISAPSLAVIKEEPTAQEITTLDSSLTSDLASGNRGSVVLDGPDIAALGNMHMHSLSSPPGMASVASAETHIGTGDSMPAVAACVEFATPTSIKITPAPSVDLQTPTPTMHGALGPKLLKADGDDNDASESHIPVFSTSKTLPVSDNASFPSVGYPDQKSSQPSAPPASDALYAAVVTAESLAKAKPNAIGIGGMARPPKMSMTPRPYGSISTPYDNIGTSSRSWLQDHPTPILTSGEVAAACSPDLDSPTVQYASLVEKSLNPVAWIKRVSARRIQHSTAVRRRRHSAAAGSTSRSSAVLASRQPSVRLLRVWLAKYKARLLYSRDFVPSYIQSARSTEMSSDMTTTDVLTDIGESCHTGAVITDLSLATASGDLTASTSLLPAGTSSLVPADLARNLQYSSASALFDDHTVGGYLSGIVQSERRHSEMSFTSIINPRKAVTGHPHMPGTLAPSLNMADLHSAAATATQSSDSFLVPRTASGSCSKVVTSDRAIDGSWVPQWLLTTRCMSELLASPNLANTLTWVAAADALAQLVKQSLTLPANVYYRAEIHIGDDSANPSLHGQPASQSGSVSVGNLGARIGGLLMLGSDQHGADYMAGTPLTKLMLHDGHDIHVPRTEDGGALRAAVSQWITGIQQTDRWVEVVETISDWATCSPLLSCIRMACEGNTNDPTLISEEMAPLITSAVSTALVSFWSSSTDDFQREGAETDRLPPTFASAVEGQLTLNKLLALDNVMTAPTAKYRGYVVKKRRIAAPVPGSTGAIGGSGSVGDSNSIGSGTIVTPSGPGAIEPLIEARILVGSHGQEDVLLPSAGSGALKSRDAESIYIKRWRYAQRLAKRATLDARIASGEIEEAEEGEEREDGEDGPAVEEELMEAVEDDWPDPDSCTAEAEDSLRRVCIATTPVSLRWWSQMHMRPIGASKDVRWLAFVPPYFGPSTSSMEAGDMDVDGVEDGLSASVREWCQTSQSIVEWYLGDVDSAYQAAHLGTHRPLGLHRVLDGTFTQLTEDNVLPLYSGPGRASAPAPPSQWSARLRYEAERLGQCMAHGWYTTSQYEQQKKNSGQQQLMVEGTLPRGGSGGRGDAASLLPLSATTLVLYMMVPRSGELAMWLAMSEAACVARAAFADTLGSLIARTSHGLPLSSSSSTMVGGAGAGSNRCVWPSLVVHPLALDSLGDWYHGQRPGPVVLPSAQETAMAIYNRCPELVQPPAAHLTTSSSLVPASVLGMGTGLASALPTTMASRISLIMQSGRERWAREHETSEFLGLSALSESRHAHSPALIDNSGGGRHNVLRTNGFSAPRTASGSAQAKKGGGGGRGIGERGGLVRRSGYYVHGTVDHQTSIAGAYYDITGFVHRAYIISMPCIFPETSLGGVVAPATIAVSRACRRSDIVLEDDAIPTSVACDAGNVPKTQSNMQLLPTTAGVSIARTSAYPAAPLRPSLSAPTIPASTTGETPQVQQKQAADALASRIEEDVSSELDEVRVSFKPLGQPPRLNGQTAVNEPLYNRLVSHPLRPNDHISTLHCVYTVIRRCASNARQTWIAVCWCDERGEYVEHDVFVDDTGRHRPTVATACNTDDDEISPAAAARIWRGCMRYQALSGGQLRVVLGEWQGMGHSQACAWREYATAWRLLQQHAQPAVHLCLVNIGTNPPDGLCLTRGAVTVADDEGNNGVVEPEFSARLQCSLVLHGHQARLRFPASWTMRPASRNTLLDEPFADSAQASGIATGYLVAVQKPLHHMCLPSASLPPVAVPCFCVQLLDVLNDPEDDIADASRSKLELQTTRSILKQYFQLAWLRHAERDSPTTPPSFTSSAVQWPVHFLPLPIGIIEDIRCALEHILM